MNKISKKIVAPVTMAAFVLTLVPAAAFADETPVDVTISQKAGDSVNVDFNASYTNVKIDVTDASGKAVNVPLQGLNGEDLSGNPAAAGTTGTSISSVDNTYEYRIPLSAGTYTITVSADGNQSISEKVDVYATAVAEASQYGVFKDGELQKTATVGVDQDLTTTIKVNDENGDATADEFASVVLYALNTTTKQVSELATFDRVKGVDGTTTKGEYTISNVANNEEVNVKFSYPGEYALFAKVNGKVLDTNYTTVTVTDETVVNSMALTDVTATIDGSDKSIELGASDFDADTNTYTLNLAEKADTFNYDGIDTITLTGIAKEEDGTVAKNQTINFATTKSTVVELKNTTDNTENDGKFSVAFTMSDKSNAVITMTDAATGLEYSVRVIAAETTAQNIDRTKTGGYVLAGNDSKYGEDTYKDATKDTPVLFTDAVQFAVTDNKGEAVTDNDAVAGSKIDVRSKADGSTLEAGDLALVWDEANGVYTLGYTGQGATVANGYAKDLIPGKYEVRVALASGDNATVTFNVAKFGKVEDMTVDMYADNYFDSQQKPTDGVHAITDEVTLGQFVAVKAYYVDANGLKVAVDPDTLQYGFDGKAVRDINADNGAFATADDTPANESLLGTVIHVKVYNKANKQLVEKDLTVVDSYNTYSLEFEPTNGPINEDNDVTVKVVDEDGNVAKITDAATLVSAYVADQSDADAKVSVDTTNATVKNGKATISVYADRETTADIVVVVKAGSAIYAGTLEYTFGTEDPLANRTVVMTIGSSDYVVNNNIVTGDAAPFVDSNWRTMVPIRALAESFDAEVNWDNDARTVTINYDANTQIVMTIGETTYTVNGEEKTMDTAPVIQGDRTYVPIRFAAEGMGFSVTPLYDSNNLTASVVFQK